MLTAISARLGSEARLRTVALVCGVAVLGVAGGRVAISHYGLPAIEALIALPILALLIPRPFASCALLLVLLCSVPFYTALPRVNVPGHPPINIGDIVLLAMVGSTLWRRPWRTWPPAVRRIYLPVALMLLVALVPTLVLAVHGHDAARTAIAGYKDLLYLTAGLTVALELSGRLWWPLVNFAVALAAIVALLSLAAAASGSIGNALLTVDAGAVQNVVGEVAGTTSRIRLPGLFFTYAMTIPTLVLVLLVKDRWRSLRLVALALMIAAIAVSLNRNMYLGGAAGILVTLLLGGTRLRFRFLVVLVTVAAVVALVVQSTVLPAVTNEVGARAQSALTTQVLASNSLQDRADEISHGLSSIAQHPWIGVGWFQPYGALARDVPRAGVEDWYVHLATDLGIPVAALFVAVALAVLAYGVTRALKTRAPLDRAFVAAGVGTLVALLLSLLVGTYLQDPNSMAAFGVACGFLIAVGLRASRASASVGTEEAGTEPAAALPVKAA
jgi:hypothetical protein